MRFNSIDFKEYEDTFDAMFNNEWTLLSVEEIGKCTCGNSCDNWIHTEWKVEYKDGNGEPRHMALDNRFTVCTIVQKYLRELINEYYKENFLDVYIGDISFEFRQPSVFYGEFVRAFDKWVCDESAEWIYATGTYRRELNTAEGAINFSGLTPANVFEMVPYYLYISIVFDEQSDHSVINQQEYEEHIISSTEDMIEAMNNFTRNTLNARIIITNAPRGEPVRAWNYIKGENIYIEPWEDGSWYFTSEHWKSPFELAVFESYKGIFW